MTLTHSSGCILGRYDIRIHFQIGRFLLGLRLWDGRLVSLFPDLLVMS